MGKRSSIQTQALQLISDPQFLFNIGKKIGELGVVGEHRSRLILFLAGIARTMPEPPSVMVKGSTSSGKSTLVKDSLRLFPPVCVISRAGLSGKAPAYRKGSFKNKILFINEFRCGKDAQLLLRLLQSEGQIEHEATVVRGQSRRTDTVESTGAPAILTTTTDRKVFEDDETRFLSLWVDESRKQTQAILMAQAGGRQKLDERDLAIWRAAVSLIEYKEGDFCSPPKWLGDVARRLPLSRVRVRRDWSRFLTFLKAVALCRFASDPRRPREISFSDYCVAFPIFEPVLASTLRGLPTQELIVGRAVKVLCQRFERPTTVVEVAKHLRWKRSLVYKHAKKAVDHKLIIYESGSREKNLKRLLPSESVTSSFLPNPKSVLEANAAIGQSVRYVDPFSGKRKIIRRNVGDAGGGKRAESW